MSIQADMGFYRVGGPADDKQRFKTLAEMKAISDADMDGTGICTCNEDGGFYVFNPQNAIDEYTGRWRRIIASVDFVDWKANTSYKLHDYVIYDNCLLKCIEAHTSTQVFAEDKWITIIGIRTEELKSIFNVDDTIIKMFDDILPLEETISNLTDSNGYYLEDSNGYKLSVK